MLALSVGSRYECSMQVKLRAAIQAALDGLAEELETRIGAELQKQIFGEEETKKTRTRKGSASFDVVAFVKANPGANAVMMRDAGGDERVVKRGILAALKAGEIRRKSRGKGSKYFAR